MKEVCIVTTFRRTELLHGCLRRLREQDADIPIRVFSDRGETSNDLVNACSKFNAYLIIQTQHDYLGNSYNAGSALRFAYDVGYELIHFVEDDCFAKPDLLSWTRMMHNDEDCPDIFATCGWCFNHFMPFNEDIYFAPWIYIPQFSIRRKKLELVLPYLNPLYYRDMWGYLAAHFPENPINKLYPKVVHYEIDGLLQRVIMQEKLQTAWCAIPKVTHEGFGGYNRGWDTYTNMFKDCTDFASRVAVIEEFAADPHWRASVFERRTVEREIGHGLPKRMIKYKLRVGEFESDFESELALRSLPRRLNSVPRTSEMEIIIE